MDKIPYRCFALLGMFIPHGLTVIFRRSASVSAFHLLRHLSTICVDCDLGKTEFEINLFIRTS